MQGILGVEVGVGKRCEAPKMLSQEAKGAEGAGNKEGVPEEGVPPPNRLGYWRNVVSSLAGSRAKVGLKTNFSAFQASRNASGYDGFRNLTSCQKTFVN